MLLSWLRSWRDVFPWRAPALAPVADPGLAAMPAAAPLPAQASEVPSPPPPPPPPTPAPPAIAMFDGWRSLDPQRPAGWVARDGTFYRCPSSGHEALARRICAEQRLVGACASGTLTAYGWVLLTSAGHVFPGPHPTTSEQRAILGELLAQPLADDYRAHLADAKRVLDAQRAADMMHFTPTDHLRIRTHPSLRRGLEEMARAGGVVCGWVAPDGVFYPCPPDDLERTTQLVARRCFGASVGAQNDARELKRLGWLRISADGDPSRAYDELTREQSSTLYFLSRDESLSSEHRLRPFSRAIAMTVSLHFKGAWWLE